MLVRDMSNKRRARPDMYARRVTVLLQYAGGVIAIVHACDAQGLLPGISSPWLTITGCDADRNSYR